MHGPTADGHLRALDVLVGGWAADAAGPDAGRGPLHLRVAGPGAHLVQRTEAGGPAPDSTCAQLYGDSRGVCRIYAMTLGGGRWTLERDADPLPQRFVGTISQDGDTTSGRWEKAGYGGGFALDFVLTYRRVTASPSASTVTVEPSV